VVNLVYHSEQTAASNKAFEYFREKLCNLDDHLKVKIIDLREEIDTSKGGQDIERSVDEQVAKRFSQIKKVSLFTADLVGTWHK
jgi:hypothetical protein